MCGEQEFLGQSQFQTHGSSPRVRGTVAKLKAAFDAARFIPACAGNRVLWPFHILQFAVHPRVCGEQSWLNIMDRVKFGSSPRVRGTEAQKVKAENDRRFIPACAGNSPGPRAGWTAAAVHPRVCGEQALRMTMAPA